MSQSRNPSALPRILQLATLAVALTACASTGTHQPGSLKAIKQSQFMPLYQQCLRDNVPLRPGRTSTMMLNEVAKACMRAANQAVK